MPSDGCKICSLIVLAVLGLIGIGLYYRKNIEDYFDRSPKFIYRNETVIKAFLIKDYYKPNTYMHHKLTIHATNDPDETELYRVHWNHSQTMVLRRIEDGFVVSRAERLNDLSYSFKLFHRSITTTGTVVQQEMKRENFDIEYTTAKHETSKIFMRSFRKQVELFVKQIEWNVMWIDMTLRFIPDNRQVMNIERINPLQYAYLEEKLNDHMKFIFGPTPYPYIYDLYVQKHLPDEFYLTTLIIANHLSQSN